MMLGLKVKKKNFFFTKKNARDLFGRKKVSCILFCKINSFLKILLKVRNMQQLENLKF